MTTCNTFIINYYNHITIEYIRDIFIDSLDISISSDIIVEIIQFMYTKNKYVQQIMFPVNRGLNDHIVFTIPYSRIEFDIPKYQNWRTYNPFESCAYHKECMPYNKVIPNNKLDKYVNNMIILKDYHFMYVYIKCLTCHKDYNEFVIAAYKRKIKLYDDRLEIDILVGSGHFIMSMTI